MSVPGLVPYFVDAETRNGVLDSSALARRLMRWQRWCHERMTGQLPCFGRHARVFASPGVYFPKLAYRFYVPAPPVPNRTLRIWWRDANLAIAGMVGVKSQRTGTIQWFDPVATDGSYGRTATVTVDAPDVIEIYVRWKSGIGSYYITGLSAWWEPRATGDLPGVTFDTTWQAYRQTGLVIATAPDSTHLLRWLARKSNQLMNDRQRFVFGATDGGNRYMLLAPYIPSITIWMYVRSSSPISIYFNFYDIGGVGAFASSTAVSVPGDSTYAWRSVTFTTGYTEARTVRCAGVNTGAAGVDIGCITFEEDQPTASSLGLPGGETIPAAFVEVDDEGLRARSHILADTDGGGSRARGRKALIENMIYLWASKVRTIWVEAPTPPALSYGGSPELANTNPPGYQTQEIVRYRATPDGWAKQLRVAGSSSIGYDSGTGEPFPDTAGQGIATGQWASENGGAATLKTLTTRIPTKEWPNEWWVEEAPAVAAGSVFIFRTLLMNPPTVGQAVRAFANGLVVEELPKGTANTTWP